jgi:hypothetical protein
MSSQLVKDIIQLQANSGLHLLQDNVRDLQCLIDGQPGECKGKWPPDMSLELMEKLKARFELKIDQAMEQGLTL